MADSLLGRPDSDRNWLGISDNTIRLRLGNLADRFRWDTQVPGSYLLGSKILGDMGIHCPTRSKQGDWIS